MKTLIIYFAKKYLVKELNDILKQHEDDVAKVTATIDKWINRLQKIIKQLKALNNRVLDCNIDDDEVKDTIAEVEQLIKEF